MSPLLIALLCAVMVATSFLSGIFGMAGGMVLVGVLLLLLPLPAAMALHAITQMASNGWRALLWWRHVQWRIAAAYAVGCLIALAVWAVWKYVPSKPVALLSLGALPFAARLLPERFKPNPESAGQGVLHGAVCMTLMLLTGVSGPILDQFFLSGRLDRRAIVATKGACQIFGHAMKLLYFGVMIDEAASVDPMLAGLAIAASMVGTTLSKRVLERMSDSTYRRWGGRIITGISSWYVAYGVYLLAVMPG